MRLSELENILYFDAGIYLNKNTIKFKRYEFKIKCTNF